MSVAGDLVREDAAPDRAMVVFAHPDDAEFTSGGTVARWAGEGSVIAYVVATDGSKGGDELDLDGAALVRLREQEQREAAALLGVAEVLFLRRADGELVSDLGLRGELAAAIRRFRPSRLLTWDAWRPYQLHPDHRAIGLTAVEAVLAAGNPRVFAGPSTAGLAPHRVAEVYLFGSDGPDIRVDVSDTFERKLAAIAAHRSQTASLLDVVEATRRCNRDYGRACGCEYAEAFKLLRPFCET